ncbi:MAG: hypothetical protein H6712_08785 [Myxococcales bacterium]|nr:hypothetical protein [Myxococcales bacterium]
MSQRPTLPTYRDLFGALDFKEGAPGRSALSPAAYLADLLQLLEDRFAKPDFFDRRPDIRELVLDGENTFTLVPYLEIVDEVLEARVTRRSEEPDAQAVLAAAEHPLGLPFEREHAQLRERLDLLKTTPQELYRLLTPRPDPDVLARASLGISDGMVRMLLDDRSGKPRALARSYGVKGPDELASLAELERFQAATGIDGPRLRELLYLQLSGTALDPDGRPELDAAAELFVNHGNDGSGYVRLNAEETRLELSSDAEAPLPAAWLDRANRLLRLAGWTGLELRSLDLVLRTLCGNVLDDAALRRLALVRSLAERHGVEVELVCGLLGDIDSLGASDDPLHAASPFDRVFNGEPAKLARAYFPSGRGYVPEPYRELTAIELTSDLLLDDNKSVRLRIQRALGISSTELTTLVEAMRERATERARVSLLSEPLGPATLALLHRVTRTAELLDITPSALLTLLDVLEADPSLRGLGAFGLVEEAIDGDDLYQVLETGSVTERSWLLHTLVAVHGWARTAGLGVEDLSAICLPPPVSDDPEEDLSDDPAAQAATAARLALCQGLLEAFVPTALDDSTLGSSELSERAARIAWRLAREADRGLVSKVDPRLVQLDLNEARRWAFDAVSALDVVTVDDLAELGLGDALAERLHEALLRRGSLDLEGNLLDAAFDDDDDGFAVEPDLDRHAEAIFDLLVGLAHEGQGQGVAPGDLELHLYPSDLLSLEIPKVEAEAILSNLRYLGVVDEQGLVSDPAWFLEPAHRSELELELGLSERAGAIREFFEGRRASFLAIPTTVPTEAFAGLGISDDEQAGLLANLAFNGILDERRRVLDKQSILELDPAGLRLALPYHRHRRAVLAILRELVARDRASWLCFTADGLRPLSDRLVADQTLAWLRSTGRLDAADRPVASLRGRLRDDDRSAFDPGPTYGEAHRTVLWAFLRRLVQEADALTLTDVATATIDLDAESSATLREMLVDGGDLLPTGGLAPDRLDTFLELNNALRFELDESDDYARDVFFLLHDLALRLDARVRGLVDALRGAAEAQRAAVVTALAAGIELGVPETTTLLAHVLRGDPQPVSTLLSPILSSLDSDGTLAEIPVHHRLGQALDRMLQFAAYARKLGLSQREIEMAFTEQGLADKFPESLVLPAGIDGIDAMLPDLEGELVLFRGARLWTFHAESLEPMLVSQPLSLISPALEGLPGIDAAYTDAAGDHWILAAGRTWCREHDDDRWVEIDRELGHVEGYAERPESIDAALTDHEGVSYLFVGDRYLRCSRGDTIDQGYPRTTADHWPAELGFELPEACAEGIDAAFTDRERRTWLFQGELVYRSDQPGGGRPIVERWGLVRNGFSGMERVDGVAEIDGVCCLFRGDQVLAHGDALERRTPVALEGFPTTIEEWKDGLPRGFEDRIDAGLTDWSGRAHLFSEQRYATQTRRGWVERPTVEVWGRVRNHLQETGRVDAAMVGLDGRLYLFSGKQYLRYSEPGASFADEGFPRTIASDWGGIDEVDAAFVLDGGTYLFGRDADGGSIYLRYGTAEYDEADEGYPKATDDDWWNLPSSLIEAGFARPDAVMNGGDGVVYLFSGNRVIQFDHVHRWWSEPRPLPEIFDGLPFQAVSAGVTDLDGHTWLFSLQPDEARGDHLAARYTDSVFTRLDDRFPKPVRSVWGRVVNRLQETGRVDAAMRMVTPVVVDEDDDELESKLLESSEELPQQQVVYLFSGDQFYRYSSPSLEWVDEGYPRRIDDALLDEPRFAELGREALARIRHGIDGLWADGSRVYLFAGATVLVASHQHHREVTELASLEGLRATVDDEGRLVGLADGGWRHLQMPEAPGSRRPPTHPRFLRGAPEPFLRPQAALVGLDGNAYLFAEGRCWDRALGRSYPISEGWGLVDAAIARDDRIDCGLRDREGRLYLFRGSEYLSFTPEGLDDGPSSRPPGPLPTVADGPPRSIAERFAGLTNVHIAYTVDETTWLCEAPDEHGRFRYLQYSDVGLEAPDFHEPRTADLSLWNIPAIHVEQGFDRVDAVLVDDRDLFLVRGREFLHYDADAEIWTYPRPLTLYWRSLPERHPDFEDIRAAFHDGEGHTWFFSDGACVACSAEGAGELLRIRDRWGKVDNRVQLDDRVDATLVWGEHTYLFAGDQYVRYTGRSYDLVDEGYPKRMAGNLRREEPFEHLPDELEDQLEDLEPRARAIDAVFANEGVVYVVSAGKVHACIDELSRSLELSALGEIRNQIHDRRRVDASFSDHRGTLWLFSGDQVYRYTEGVDERGNVDDGFPRSIADHLLSTMTLGAEELPLAFHHELDAAMLGTDGALLLSKDQDFLRLWPRATEREAERGSIAELWQRPVNPFLPPSGAGEEEARPHIDAAFLGHDGALYAFKGAHYVRYSDPRADYVDEGYPRAIRDDWGDLPPELEAGIDGAFTFEGRHYLVRGDRYVRYSDPSFARVDPLGAQPFTRRWRSANDYLLRDLHLLWRLIDLDRSHADTDDSLVDFLVPGPRDQAEPYATLAAIFGWEVDDLNWIKRRDGFLDRPGLQRADEVELDLELLLRIIDVMTLCERLGSYPQELHEQVWIPLFDPERRDRPAAVDTLTRLLGTLYLGTDALRITRQLADADNEARRDALVPWLIAREPSLQHPRDLYEELLIDVEVAPSIDTSRIKEAAAAIQLYFHRYLVSLEQLAPKGEPKAVVDDRVVRARFKEQWSWLKSYRVWEANRKVFLHPESYIRPELRDTRTPSFRTLQDDLLQGELTDLRATEAYKKYLDEYTEISRLAIAGGYVREGSTRSSNRELVLFGHTRTDPRRYYYRTATFIDGQTDTATWDAWQALDIEIDSDRVYPVDAFGRLFVFWTQVEADSGDTNTTTIQRDTDGDDETLTGKNDTTRTLQVYYSYHDLNQRWISAQTLELSATETSSIDAAELVVERSQSLGSEAQENIVIGLSYSVDGSTKRLAASLTADLATQTNTRAPIDSAGIELFSTLFASSEQPDAVVRMNTSADSAEGPWYSFDLKGGSFLCKPAVGSIDTNVVGLRPLRGNPHHLPQWDRVDAGFRASDGSTYFFDGPGGRYARLSADGELEEHETFRRWGHMDNPIARAETIDAAWWMGDRLFVSQGGHYLRYSKGTLLADAQGALSLAGNGDGLPRWPRIDAAFTDATGQTHFFGSGKWTRSGALQQERPIKDHWGKASNDFTAASGGNDAVRAAFVHGEHTFVVGPREYIRYSTSSYGSCDPGYPRAQSLRAILDELGCDDDDETHGSLTVDAVVIESTRIVITVNGNRAFALKNRKLREIETRLGAGRGINRGIGPTRAVVTIAGKELVFGRDGDKSLQVASDKLTLARPITAAMVGRDDQLYLFDAGQFVALPAAGVSPAKIDATVDEWGASAKPLGDRWGHTDNAILRNNRIDAALRVGNHTFLVCEGEYLRYTGKDYDAADRGYPKPLAGNPDGLPEWDSISAAVEDAGGQGNACFFRGKQHAFARSLSTLEDNRSRWGLIANELLARGVDAAWVEDKLHMLVCGQQLVRYTANEAGELGRFMDAGYPKSLAVSHFGSVDAAFVIGDDFYVVGDNIFVCCAVSDPEAIRAGYPKKGRLGELLDDLNDRHGTQQAVSSAFGHYGVGAVSVDGTGRKVRIEIDTSSGGRNTLVGTLDLDRGKLEASWERLSSIWTSTIADPFRHLTSASASSQAAELSVVVGDQRYLFRGDQFMRVSADVPAGSPRWSPDPRGVDGVWGAASVDAALRLDGSIYLFLGDQYVKAPGGGEVGDLSSARSIDGAWGNLPAPLREGIDAALYSEGALTLFKGDHYLHYPPDGPQPYEVSTVRYDIVRLTTATAATLNQRLFTSGLSGLLSLRTQETDETPRFSSRSSSSTTIRFAPKRVRSYPIGSHLDFGSANGIYYWEIFFHAPFLIAQSLNTSQRFDEARGWYEHVFDPTENPDVWKFLPFLAADVEQIVARIDDRLGRLRDAKVQTRSVDGDFLEITRFLAPLDAAFQGERPLKDDEQQQLRRYADLSGLLAKVEALDAREPEASEARQDLAEMVGIVEQLSSTWAAMQSSEAQLQVFLDDPFDPHAIAGLRRIAYRKALLMRYIDNLIDWGDMLFSQYTRETIDEARMLYVLAWDLLGRRPTPLGRKVLPQERSYAELHDQDDGYDFLLYLESGLDPRATDLSFAGKAPQTIAWPSYFFLPENTELVAYWDRVEDRLYKIRHGLNIMGVEQPLPLFQPPLDPMAVVSALAGGAGLAAALGSTGSLRVPHYRFSYLMAKAQAMVAKLQQFGGDLLATLEKRDSEKLSRLQARQETEIWTMTLDVRRSQLEEAMTAELGLQAARSGADKRKTQYQAWIDNGLNGYEIAQLSLMSSSVVAHVVAVIARIVASIGGAVPDVTVGPFSTGVEAGGDQTNRTANSVAEVAQSTAEGLSISGEILGIVAQHIRMKDEWTLQRDLADYDVQQIDQQILGAQASVAGARQELAIVQRQIAHDEEVADHYRSKFSNQELYQWMVGRLSSLYYQTYQLALDYARAAQRAYQFETGLPEHEVDFIRGHYWSSQHEGLGAGDALGLDLDRMEARYIETDARRLELTMQISLLEHDPLALLRLQREGSCEIELGEALFDYEFPGHYCRQIKTIALKFETESGQTVSATLTQLTNRTVLHPDPKAVGFLLDAKGEPPSSLRTDWKAQQQIAVAYHDQYDKNNGMFELRFDSERYLPFEGTGAVSRWRLELAGKPGSYERSEIGDVVIELSYSALPGGEAFAAAVRGQLKPYDALRHLDVKAQFAEPWQRFSSGIDDDLVLPLTRDLFPNMASSRIRTVLAHYSVAPSEDGRPASVGMSMELGDSVALPEGRLVDSSGLRIGGGGTTLTLKAKGNRQLLRNLVLVMSYRAAVR